MVQAGEAARAGASTDAAKRAFKQLAKDAPLNPQPFAYFGALAESRQHSDEARSLFLSALRRDPRSLSAHYFLATNALRAGRVDEGLTELSNLARIYPGAVNFAQVFVDYARSGGDTAVLRRFFNKNPDQRDQLLFALAAEPDNADLVVSLAGPPNSTALPDDQNWRARLIESLVAAGRYDDARRRWAELTGSRIPNGLAAPDFGRSLYPVPFNWTYGNGDAALVEPAGNGALSILYYGRADAVIAEQLAFLSVGTARLTSRAKVNSGAAGLKWTVTCLPGGDAIADVPVQNGTADAVFTVPGNCNVQRIELRASAVDAAGGGRWTVLPLSLVSAQ